jgi:lysyl-tRNA synthetase class 2
MFERITILHDRAYMLQQVRSFFAARKVLEVDCPCITAAACIDAHIDLMPISYANQETRYLHSSPEYGMKRLLADGIGDIYQLSHVFRDSEWSHKHNPEFMMAEWYRLGISFEEMINETCDFVRLFLGNLPCQYITYREAFQKYVGIDYVSASIEQLYQIVLNQGVKPYVSLEEAKKDDLLFLLVAIVIEPSFDPDVITALTHFPSSQAALAKTSYRDDEAAAERFELYYKGIELANGYHELANAEEQRQRLIEANQERKALGKRELPIDEAFLKALEKGLPECCGVAVGFDRLMMLRHKTETIHHVIPFGWDQA